MRMPDWCAALVVAVLLGATPAHAFDVVISEQGEFADLYVPNGSAFPPKYVFIDPDPVVPICPTPTDPNCSKRPRERAC